MSSDNRLPPGSSLEDGGFCATIFHEPWWLSAATNDQYDQVTVKRANKVIARLPFVVKQRMGFRTLRMPLFTHLLGPIVVTGDGKYQTQLSHRLSIVRDLIDQLPSFHFFKQAFDPSIANGLAIADGLAFQEHGFMIMPQYNFQVDCRSDLNNIWDDMHFKTRQHIRHAEQKYSVTPLDDPDQFVRFYVDNLIERVRNAQSSFKTFTSLYSDVVLERVEKFWLPSCRTERRPL